MFYYYGAKHALSRHYSAPLHQTVVEPFAGSAQYAVHALVSGQAQHAILYDTDPRVVELWERLLSMTPDAVLNLPDIRPGEKTSDPLHFVIAASNSWGGVRSMTVSSRMAQRWVNMRQNMARRLPSLVGRVELHHASYEQSVQPHEATYFVDPPYWVPEDVKSGRGLGYARGSNSASLDFDWLGAWCQSLHGQVIVCEQAGAPWLPFQPLRNVLNSQGRMTSEVVWENR